MIGALERLRQQHPQPLPDQMAAFGISGALGQGLKRLFMTHPPLEERIAALRSASDGQGAPSVRVGLSARLLAVRRQASARRHS